MSIFKGSGKGQKESRRSFTGALVMAAVLAGLTIVVKVGEWAFAKTEKTMTPEQADEWVSDEFASWIERKTSFEVEQFELIKKEYGEKIGALTDSSCYYYTRILKMCSDVDYIASAPVERKRFEYDYTKKQMEALSAKNMSPRDSMDFRVHEMKLSFLGRLKGGLPINTKPLSRKAAEEKASHEDVSGYTVLADVVFSDSTKARVLYAVDEMKRVSVLNINEKKYHSKQNNPKQDAHSD